MRLQITDNDGFLALADAKTYVTFVTENWELDQLFLHFVKQMNQEKFLIWRTGNEGGTWNVDFVKERSSLDSYREFKAIISVTDQKLYLTEYGDLTMAASYPEYKIPSSHNSDLYYVLENGMQLITVRQLFNPNLNPQSIAHNPHFEIITKLLETHPQSNSFEKIEWFE